ncbi:MAG TPA: M14 family zinc carboxypeptidase [Thermoleophilaceae bacterium]|nr:M14 family zinc carboxypeptidase [Thermoleophilaceae bacterium]
MKLRIVGVLAFVCAFVPATAQAGPVATTDAQYTAYGRVFPDPQGGACSSPCSPLAQGNVAATQFIGYQEFVDAVTYMNSKEDWQRFLEVWPLDTGEFPGNDLGRREFKPNEEFVSAGLPTTTLDRQKAKLFMLRVTDESVPDKGKKRYALSLSIHGIERAGAEGGIRAMEDLVTATTSDRLQEKIIGTEGISVPIPTFEEVLKKSIIYFTLPNPDGWRRGSVAEGGFFFQRYNGNGVDLNRDWPDKGFAFRPYSAFSEPESRAFSSAFLDIAKKGKFAAGDDLHGQPTADSFSYTLIPHGSKHFAKNERIRETAKTINLVQADVLSWHPIIQPNDAPPPTCVPTAVSDVCGQMYGQNWGTVYDTINYTTTGALGDWFDSRAGLNADGIDNEMSFSHIDRNIQFEPTTEQLHVDGNKGLIYAHLAEILGRTTRKYRAKGRKGYVPLPRLKRKLKQARTGAPPGTSPQEDIDELVPISGPDQAIFEFEVKRDAKTFNGGMRVDVTQPNVQGVTPGALVHSLDVQCRGCDRHPGVTDDDEWVTVAEDYNQSGTYAQAGITAAINDPQPSGKNGKPVEWRAVVTQPAGPAVRVRVDFSRGSATLDGTTGGGLAPVRKAYNVAATDFWKSLRKFTKGKKRRFRKVNARKLARKKKAQVPRKLDTLVLTDQALPGYVYPVKKGDTTPQQDEEFESATPTAPCAYQEGTPRVPTCYEQFDFKVEEGTSSATVTINFSAPNDLALEVVRVTEDGEESMGFTDGGTPQEQIEIVEPPAGDYQIFVHNFAAADSSFTGSIDFGPKRFGNAGKKSRYTKKQYKRYVKKLKRFVRKRGGNLVLTDGALQALPDLFPKKIKRADVTKGTVYVGEIAFSTAASDTQDPESEGNTLADPLAKNVFQPGARFNTGLRRQTYEPTPIGYSIQNAETGADESHSPLWQVNREAFESVGGRVAATGVSAGGQVIDSGATLGEIKLGKGVVRIIGALLPQPTKEFDHQEGLEPHAVTYTGYFLMENLTSYKRPRR